MIFYLWPYEEKAFWGLCFIFSRLLKQIQEYISPGNNRRFFGWFSVVFRYRKSRLLVKFKNARKPANMIDMTCETTKPNNQIYNQTNQTKKVKHKVNKAVNSNSSHLNGEKNTTAKSQHRRNLLVWSRCFSSSVHF